MMLQGNLTAPYVIHTFALQPFESRQGRNTVIGLRFPFNQSIAQILTQCCADHRQRLYDPVYDQLIDPENLILAAGGWLAREQCWFVERAIWLTVQVELEAAGYQINAECEVAQ